MTTTPAARTTAREALEQAIGRVAPEADLSLVGPDESLREALDLDSMDFLAVVEAVAELTGVSVPESDYLTVDSPAGFVAYLEARMP
jgi:acyl carrier protein